MKNYQFAVGLIEQQIQTLMASFPELLEDADLRADTLEGETDLHKVMDKVVLACRDYAMLAKGSKFLIDTLKERQGVLEKRSEFNRTLAQRLMEIAGVKSLELSSGKISVVNSPKKVIITNEDAIPDLYLRTKKEPNKTAIKEALEKGDEVPGAMLSNGGNTIQIR